MRGRDSPSCSASRSRSKRVPQNARRCRAPSCRPLLGVTVQPHLAALGIGHLLQDAPCVRPGGCDGPMAASASNRRLTLAADHDVAVTVLPQATVTCSSVAMPRSSTTRDPRRRLEAPTSMPLRVRSSLTLPANTRERLHEAATIQHQPQGEQLAIAALLLRMTRAARWADPTASPS